MSRRLLFSLMGLVVLAGCATTPMEERAGDQAAAGPAMAGEEAIGVGDPAGSITADPLAADIVPGSQKDLEVNVGDRVFFAFDSAALDEEAQATLDRQAAWLLQYPDIVVTIEGHADERGTREYNLALGERRAMAVKNYLVAKGVSPDRILTISYGEERPVDPGHNEAAWALNRRAVTVVTVTQ